MSQIYLGNPLEGAGMVAIKELFVSDNEAEKEEDLKQFANEYALLRELQHPALPRALDSFEENGGHYLVEEFVPGETLEMRLQDRGRLPVGEAVAIGLQILDVLDYLHSKKVIYRDLKPSNILLRRDQTMRLIDFGAARRYRVGAQRDTVPLGTPGFASPEHYGRAQTDERSDIYCAGAVLHYMLSGHDPAEGQPWKFEAPNDLYPDIPSGLSDLVMDAVEIDPADRFQTVAAMKRALLELRIPLDPAIARPNHAHALVTLRRRLQFVDKRDYYRILETAAIGVFGLFFFAVSFPAWLTNVPLPHPLVGAWLTAYAVAHPYTNWKRYRGMVVEIYHEGMRISNDGDAQEIFWTDVIRMPVTQKAAEIFTHSGHYHLDVAWPGYWDVVHEVINNAGLVERNANAAWYTYIDSDETLYERAV